MSDGIPADQGTVNDLVRSVLFDATTGSLEVETLGRMLLLLISNADERDDETGEGAHLEAARDPPPSEV